MIVLKFGGTSVGTADSIKQVCGIIKSAKEPYVVVSAVSGVTDKLIEAIECAKTRKDMCATLREIRSKHTCIMDALGLDKTLLDAELESLKAALHEISNLNELTPKARDIILSFGERMSSKLISEYLRASGLVSKHYTGWDAGIVTDSDFTKANYLEESFENIQERMSKLDHIPVITGFIAKNKNNEITTLGRGGSDTTAALIGAGVGTSEIQIWSDVNGVMTSDPRICKNAKTLDVLSFHEAAELAYFGAKILHPQTIQPAMKKQIPVVVKNTFNPKHPGTRVVYKKEKRTSITGIAMKKNITEYTIESGRMLNAYGFLSRIFNVFNENKVSVDMVATSEVSVSLTVDEAPPDMKTILAELSKIGTVTSKHNHSIICIVGDGIKDNPKLKGDIINTITSNDIHIKMISQGASSINIGLVVDGKDAEKTVLALHKRFIENN